MKRFLATTALLMLPIAAIADGMDEDRIKELVLEAIRENPGIVFEAAQLFEQQQQALQAQSFLIMVNVVVQVQDFTFKKVFMMNF